MTTLSSAYYALLYSVDMYAMRPILLILLILAFLLILIGAIIAIYTFYVYIRFHSNKG